MKTTIVHGVILFFLLFSPFAGAQKVYKGKVKVFQQLMEKKKGYLNMQLDITVCGLPVGKHRSLLLMPMLKAGRDSLVLQPIVLNGRNKQKMYERTLALHGKRMADDGAYMVLPNYSSSILQIPYEQEFPYRKWMKDAQLILVGQFCDYDGNPVQTHVDILTEKIRITD